MFCQPDVFFSDNVQGGPGGGQDQQGQHHESSSQTQTGKYEGKYILYKYKVYDIQSNTNRKV